MLEMSIMYSNNEISIIVIHWVLGLNIQHNIVFCDVFHVQIEKKKLKLEFLNPEARKKYPKTMLGTGAFGLFKNHRCIAAVAPAAASGLALRDE